MERRHVSTTALWALYRAQQADGQGGGGSGSLTVNTSAIPGTHLLASVVHPGFATLSDADLVRDAAPVGVVLDPGRVTLGPGPLSILFASDGGDPRPPQRVYLASGLQDGGTARGKATAAAPRKGILANQSFNGRPPTNEVDLGLCVDFDPITRLGKVLFEPSLLSPTHLEDELFESPARTTLPTDADYYFTDVTVGNLSQISLATNASMLVQFEITDLTVAGTYAIVSCTDPGGTKGWDFEVLVNAVSKVGVLYFRTFGAGASLTAIANVFLGLHTVVVSVDGAGLASLMVDAGVDLFVSNTWSNNFLVQTPMGSDIDATCQLRFGGPAVGAIHGWTIGTLLFVGHKNRSLAGWEITRDTNITPVPPRYRYRRIGAISSQSFSGVGPPESDPWTSDQGFINTVNDLPMNDASTAWYWLPFIEGGLLPGQGTRLVLSIAGAPTTNFGPAEQFYGRLTDNFLDTLPVIEDVHGMPRGSAMARLKFTIPPGTNDLCVGVRCNDVEDNDNDCAVIFKDGAFYAQVLQTDGTLGSWGLTYFWLRVTEGDGTPTSHDIEIWSSLHWTHSPDNGRDLVGAFPVALVAAPQAGIVESVASAGMTFVTETIPVARRLVFVANQQTGGQNNGGAGRNGFPIGSAAAGARLRMAGTPGHVMTCLGSMWESLIEKSQLPGGIPRLARDIVEAALQGTPTDLWILTTYGYEDWQNDPSLQGRPAITPAAFGVLYAELWDAIHALLGDGPALHYAAMEMVNPNIDAVMNPGGFTGSQYNAQILALATGRPWLQLINARVPGVINWRPPPNVDLNGPADNITLESNIHAVFSY